ncbi:NADPH-dependent FMN reductase [Nitrososphaera viennensis]|uniref:NAD(P)H-dependent oxidoreductase n=2 Tax=Nitrososphaera viennensis TaxID=1034015 RepID=A0A977NM09_9ARCH|nr:NAD(P)H-dependent oxidoreductase [Nitrososphaera viennensis]AIC17019.1 putative NADPH-dependent FMN reductase [Nitrososphaera viennensis EN76]UVS68916.1 NAD(P)H-dependent oxidoreductase [Nitrososphaera viennensis]
MDMERNMQSTINILGVAGSMRSGSYSTEALKMALELAKKHGAEVRLLDLSKTVLPLRDPSAPASEQVEAAAKAVAWADALILASPDYHGSMSGTIKNFLDHFYKEFAGKLFGYIVASHEKGLTAMDQMRTAVRQCCGWSMPYGVSINGEQDFANGQIANAEVSRRLEMMSRDLVVYGRLMRGQFARDLGSSEPYTFAAHYRVLLKSAS